MIYIMFQPVTHSRKTWKVIPLEKNKMFFNLTVVDLHSTWNYDRYLPHMKRKFANHIVNYVKIFLGLWLWINQNCINLFIVISVLKKHTGTLFGSMQKLRKLGKSHWELARSHYEQQWKSCDFVGIPYQRSQYRLYHIIDFQHFACMLIWDLKFWISRTWWWMVYCWIYLTHLTYFVIWLVGNAFQYYLEW